MLKNVQKSLKKEKNVKRTWKKSDPSKKRKFFSENWVKDNYNKVINISSNN